MPTGLLAALVSAVIPGSGLTLSLEPYIIRVHRLAIDTVIKS